MSRERLRQEGRDDGAVGGAGAAVAKVVEPRTVGAEFGEIIPAEAIEGNEQQCAICGAAKPTDTGEEGHEKAEQHAGCLWFRFGILFPKRRAKVNANWLQREPMTDSDSESSAGHVFGSDVT